jgi:hypothetical protein
MTLVIAAWVLVGWAGQASAGSIAPGGPTPWYEFLWSGPVGTFAQGGSGAIPSSGGNSQYADSPAWTFTSPADGSDFTVTDAFAKGDAFNVYDFGTLIGATPIVALSSDLNSDPAVSVLDPTYSHRSFSLGAGAHSITLSLAAEFSANGAGYFRLDNAAVPSPVPLPSAGLGGGVLLGLLALARKWRTATV